MKYEAFPNWSSKSSVKGKGQELVFEILYWRMISSALYLCVLDPHPCWRKKSLFCLTKLSVLGRCSGETLRFIIGSLKFLLFIVSIVDGSIDFSSRAYHRFSWCCWPIIQGLCTISSFGPLHYMYLSLVLVLHLLSIFF